MISQFLQIPTKSLSYCWIASLLMGTTLSDSLPAALVQTGNVTPNVNAWTSSPGGEYSIGNTSVGSVMVNGGSLLASYSVSLGGDSGVTGAATVTGAGSTWTNGFGLIVGVSGNGALAIEAGGQFNSRGGSLGLYSGSTGAATVTGVGSKWITSNGGGIEAGRAGAGSLTIEAGGQVSSSYGLLGDSSGSTGTATVTGAGSKWTNSDSLLVGKDGSGALTVSNGGEVVANTLFASLSDLHGDGTITATGAVLDADFTFDAAYGASPSLAFGSGGTLNIMNGGVLGVGYRQSGSLIISEGIEVSSGPGYLGYNSGATGTATVTGAGSTWTNTGGFYVGYTGSGALAIEAGGGVSSFNSSYIGARSGSTGTATVTGAGSTWTNTGGFYVGYTGSGALTIEDSGLVSVGETLTIGNSSFINLATGGMLAIHGDADDSLSQFLGLVQGTDAIRFWDDSLSAWAPLTTATLGVDYALEYLAAGDLAGYTLLTVGGAIGPDLAGDFNADGSVDGADFLAWQRGESPDPLGADDLDVWKNGFGDAGPSPAATRNAVPEPRAGTLGSIALGLLFAFGPQRPRLAIPFATNK